VESIEKHAMLHTMTRDGVYSCHHQSPVIGEQYGNLRRMRFNAILPTVATMRTGAGAIF
jgi:hypothetical protein